MSEQNSQNNKDRKYRLLTKQEIHETARERVHLIAKEFTDGFEFISRYPKSVTVFGGLHVAEDSPYYVKARSLAYKIVNELKYAVFTGGGPGIMEAANRGAFEAGGESLGLSIEIEPKQEQNPYLTDSIDFFYFFSRKVSMSFSAEAYIFFPGGFGTMDEFFEILTLVQTGKIEKVPIILVGSDFWNALNVVIKNEMLAKGTISDADMNLYKITDDEDEVVEIIREAPIRNGVKFDEKELEKHGLKIEKYKNETE